MTIPLIINFTPTGMVPTKSMTPKVPISVDEIVEDVHRAYELGITLTHLHAREYDETPTYRPEVYEAIILGIRRYAPDLVICVSLSGRNFGEFEKRSAPLTLEGKTKPDMGSLTLGSLNFSKQVSVNSPDMIQALAYEMNKRKILCELEVFDCGMINYAKHLIKKGFLAPPYYFNILLGNIFSAQIDPIHIGMLIRELPKESFWSLGGFGETQLIANTMAILLNGGVRVGLEDNIYWDRERNQMASNLELIKRIHELTSIFSRKVMKPSEFRNLFNLENEEGKYGLKYRQDSDASLQKAM